MAQVLHTSTRTPLLARGMHGFAYLWTLMLVAFMGIALVIASEVYSIEAQRQKERELIFIGRQFRNAIGRYYESVGAGAQRQYPATLEDLLKDARFPDTRRHLRRIYTDPMTGSGKWGTILVKGRVAGVYSLSEKTPIKQDNFEINEASFRGKETYAEWVFTYPPDLLLAAAKNVGAPDRPIAAESIMGSDITKSGQDEKPPQGAK